MLAPRIVLRCSDGGVDVGSILVWREWPFGEVWGVSGSNVVLVWILLLVVAAVVVVVVASVVVAVVDARF